MTVHVEDQSNSLVQALTPPRVFAADTSAVTALAREAILQWLSVDIDMMLDCQDEMAPDRFSYAALTDHYREQSVRNNASAMAEDFLNDFKQAVIKQIMESNFSVAVRSVAYTTGGEVEDVAVDITHR